VRDKALGPLLDWARAVVPARQRARTPAFLLGTAGLRKLAPEARHALLADIRACLAASGFRRAPGS
jgi:Golgi nucleoside diphosphatase